MIGIATVEDEVRALNRQAQKIASNAGLGFAIDCTLDIPTGEQILIGYRSTMCVDVVDDDGGDELDRPVTYDHQNEFGFNSH